MAEAINPPHVYVYRNLTDVCHYINTKYYPNDRKDFFDYLVNKYRWDLESGGFIGICCSDYDNEEQWVKDFVQHLKEEFTDGFTDCFTVRV